MTNEKQERVNFLADPVTASRCDGVAIAFRYRLTYGGSSVRAEIFERDEKSLMLVCPFEKTLFMAD